MRQTALSPCGPKTAPDVQLQVHETINAQQRRKVLKFRNQIMVDELGIDATIPSEAQRRDEAARDEAARHLYLTAGQEIVGCLRLYASDMVVPSEQMIAAYLLDAFMEFGPECLSFSDHMAIAKAWRGGRVSALMKAAAFKLARNSGALFDFTHCPPALVSLFEKLGYRSYGGEQLQTDAGLQIPLVLVMDDVEYLRQINSPFAALTTSQPPDPNVVKWFHDTFPKACQRPVKALRNEDRLWQYLTQQLHQNPLHGIPLFDGLNRKEARLLLRSASTLALRDGDYLARAGEVNSEIYVILSGTVEVRDAAGAVLADFGKGSTVGEIAYLSAVPRTADIVVVQDAEVLVLTQSLFPAMIESAPKLASKVLFNLTLILAERLTATSQKLSSYSQGV